MPGLHLIANTVLGTAYGHMQLVFDADGIFGNGDELELEVQAPILIGLGDWDVRPVQAMEVPDPNVRYTLDVDDAAATWGLLIKARAALAAEPIFYELGLFGLEGQNSNSYIVTLAHIADIDVSAGLDVLLSAGVIDELPGAGRNVLFDRIDGTGADIAPYDLVLAGTAKGEAIRGGAGSDRIKGVGGDDAIAGHGGRDRLFGGAGRDDLRGDSGRDRLKGGAGADLIFGGAGKDRISGDRGNDILVGGTGADVFVFNGLVDQGSDRIRDFRLGVDLIQVSGLTFAEIEISGGGNAHILLDGLTEITLRGVAAVEVGADDFLFT